MELRWPSGQSAKVELQDFNLKRARGPMTEERLVLAELLEKAGGLPRPYPRHPPRRAAAAHPEAAAGQLFPAIPGSPQELGEGADRGGLRRAEAFAEVYPVYHCDRRFTTGACLLPQSVPWAATPIG